MSLKINFFPLHFIFTCLTVISLCVVFSGTIYLYMSANIYINGLIIILFVFTMIWIVGVLSYYSKSVGVLNKLFVVINPSVSSKLTDDPMLKNPASLAAALSSTLVDSPIVSRIVLNAVRTGNRSINFSDASSIIDVILENGTRVLGPSRFLTSIFTMLGLIGTFIGLLQTIAGVARALATLANIQNVDVLGFIQLLADPLEGMSIAFSTSLFGLAAALLGNYGNYVATHRLDILVSKVRRVFAAAVNISLDPSRIEAKDILLALDDALNKLYGGLSDKLTELNDSVIVMARAVVKNQDKQEEMSMRMLDSMDGFKQLHATLDSFAEGFSNIIKLPDLLGEIVDENRDLVLDYLDDSIIPSLESLVSSNTDLLRAMGSSNDVWLSLDESVKEISKINSSIEANTNAIVVVSEQANDIAEEALKVSKDGMLKIENIETQTVFIQEDLHKYDIPLSRISDLMDSRVEAAKDSNLYLQNIDSNISNLGRDLTTSNDICNDTLANLVDISELQNNNLSYVADMVQSLPITEAIDSGLEDIKRILDQLHPKIGDLNSVVTGFANDMMMVLDRNMESNSNYMGNILDTLKDALAAQNSMRDDVRYGFEEMQEHMPRFVNSFEELVSSSNIQMGEFLYDLSNDMRNMGDRFAQLSNIGVNIENRMVSLGEELNILSSGVSELSSFVALWEGISQENMQYTADLNQSLSGLVGLVDENNANLLQLSEQLGYTVESVNQNSSIFNDSLSYLSAINSSSEVMGDAVLGMSAEINNMSDVVSGSLESLANSLGDISETYIGTYEQNQQFLTPLAQYLESSVSVNERNFEAMFRVSENLEAATASLVEGVVGSLGNIESMVGDLGTILSESFSEFSSVSSLLEGVNTFLDSALNSQIESLANISVDIAQFNQIQEGFLERFREDHSSLIESLGDGLSTISTNISDLTNSLSGIDSMVSDISASVITIGEAYIGLLEKLDRQSDDLSGVMVKLDLNNELLSQGIATSEAVNNRMVDAIGVASSGVDGVVASLGQLSVNMEEMGALLREVMNNLGVDGVGALGNQILSNVTASVSDLRSELQHGNGRMDVIANAIDALITEMFNSREVIVEILNTLSLNNNNSEK